MGNNKYLMRQGLTNNASEDYGTFVSSKTRIYFDNFCTSEQCCTVVTSENIVNVRVKVKAIVDGVEKTVDGYEPQLYKTFKRLPMILKKTSLHLVGSCPDCGGLMFSKRSKKKYVGDYE